MRGRPPKPAAMKRAAGNPGKRAIVEPVAMPASATPPRVPRGMPKEGATLWRRLAPLLWERGVLTEADLPAFEMMCIHWAIAVRARARILREGSVTVDERGLPRKHPLLQVWRDNSKAWREYAVQFGLTPVARERLHVADGDGGTSLAELLFGAAGGG